MYPCMLYSYYLAKSGTSILKIDQAMLNLVFGGNFFFGVHFFFEKSGASSLKIDQVMLNLVSGGHFLFWRPFCFWNLFGLSIPTFMQNLDSVAQEMSELCSILRFGGHFWLSYCIII